MFAPGPPLELNELVNPGVDVLGGDAVTVTLSNRAE